MELLWQLEIQINIFLQSLGAWLTTPMSAFTFLGTEYFYLAILPILFWCVDSAIGARIGAMLIFSNWINYMVKFSFHGARPFWFDARVKALSSEVSFGIPSNHAMGAASMWGLMANQVKKRWFTILSLVVIFMIGLSRLYLGMHFLSDVAVGWLLGWLLLMAFIKLEKPIVDWIKAKTLEQQLSILLVSSLFALILILLIQFFSRNWQMPDAWLNNAINANPAHAPDPFSLEGPVTIAGLWLGMLGGLAWFYHRYGMFNARGVFWKRLVRYIVGMVGIVVFWYGLGEVLPGGTDLVSYTLRYLRYALLGAWVSALAPWLFIRLRLASKYEK